MQIGARLAGFWIGLDANGIVRSGLNLITDILDLSKIESGTVNAEPSASRLRFARVDFDTRSGEIRVDGELITLERKPREMLRVFLKRPGELLTKSELLDAVWPGRIAREGSLTNCIAKLRSAINDPEGDIPPTPGNKLVLSVDIKLQAMVEEMFGDRRGALVAIDPRSGEVLAFVSKPTFDPNLFVDGIDPVSWRELNEDIV